MKPNIVFLMTDEQRYDCIGYENSQVITPNLCALSADCVRYRHAYTTNPSCVPARAAIFSGKYPSQCGAPAYITPLAANETTYMSILQQAGYYTAAIGKQHFAGTLAPHGYDYEDIIDSHFPKLDVDNSYASYLRSLGYTSLDQFTERDGRWAWKWKAELKTHVDEYVGNRGREWLEKESVRLDQPWFCTISFPGPHMPYNGLGLPTEELYDEDSLQGAATVQDDLKQKPDYYMEQIRSGKGNPGLKPVTDATPQEIRHTKKAYYSTMSLIDRKIGEILEVLKKTGQYDNTLIFFTSDHGDYMGEFGMFGKGQYLSESLTRIPLLMKPPVPGFQGMDCQDYAMNFDIAATCISVAGKKDAIPDMAARDLSGYWEETKANDPPEFLYTEALNVRAIQNKQWKLIYYQDRSYGELYHLEQDPVEKYNLFGKEEYREIQQMLLCRLCDKMIELGRNSGSQWNYAAPVI